MVPTLPDGGPAFIELYDKHRRRGWKWTGSTARKVPREEWNETIAEFVKERRINYPCLLGDDATRGKSLTSRAFPRRSSSIGKVSSA